MSSEIDDGAGQRVTGKPLFSVPLPLSAGAIPNGIHTVVRDDFGNLYLSDEFNHLVLSLDPRGGLRWRLGGRGGGPGEFYRPCGIALGQIVADGASTACLGVCDSWNGRIQFLSLDGRLICSWDHAGEQAFADVADIRYFSGGAGTADYWLVLDRGNHRLAALGTGGGLLLSIGRGFPPQLETRHEKCGLEPASDFLPPGQAHDFPVYEPLYYPSRILGQSEQSICLLQPSSGELKRPLFGCLFPLPLRPPEGGEWIAAQADSFLAWNADGRTLSWLDSSGRVVQEARAEGRPVCSGLRVDEVWLESASQLELRSYGWESPRPETQDPAIPLAAFAGAAVADLDRLESSGLESPFSGLLSMASSVIEHADQVLAASGQVAGERPQSAPGPDALAATRERIAAFRMNMSRRLHALWLAGLQARLVSQAAPGREAPTPVTPLQERVELETRPLRETVAQAVERMGRSLLLRQDLLASGETEEGPRVSVLQNLETGLSLLIAELRRWSGAEFCSTRIREVPMPSATSCGKQQAAGAPGSWIRRPAVCCGRPRSRYLREIDRMIVAPGEGGDSPNPIGLAESEDGHLYVSLFTAGKVVRLDRNGRIEGEIGAADPRTGLFAGPAGLAADGTGRIWIVEHRGNKLAVHDPGSGTTREVPGQPALPEGLQGPVGISPGPGHSMLVTDSGNHRVVALRGDGSMEVFRHRRGTGQGEFRRPIGVCPSRSGGGSSYWVVDQRNHRLQRFGADSGFLQEIGRCGPGTDSFLVPQYVAQFDDGVLAISQNQIQRNVKLFTPDGREIDCLFLDYMPGGILVSGERMFVAEWNGSGVRVYEKSR